MFDKEGHWIDDPFMVVNQKIDLAAIERDADSLERLILKDSTPHICCHCIHEEVCQRDSNVVPMDNSGNCKLFKLKED